MLCCAYGRKGSQLRCKCNSNNNNNFNFKSEEEEEEWVKKRWQLLLLLTDHINPDKWINQQIIRGCKQGRGCLSWPEPIGVPVAAQKSRGTWRCAPHQHDLDDLWKEPKPPECSAVLPLRIRAGQRILLLILSELNALALRGRDDLAIRHPPNASHELLSIPRRKLLVSAVDVMPLSVHLPIPVPKKSWLIIVYKYIKKKE